MAEITEYEYRLSQALDRMARWAERNPQQGAAGSDEPAALAAERELNAQLRARVDELSARQTEVIARLEADLSQARAEAAALREAAAAREAGMTELAQGLEAWLAGDESREEMGAEHA